MSKIHACGLSFAPILPATSERLRSTHCESSNAIPRIRNREIAIHCEKRFFNVEQCKGMPMVGQIG